MIWRVETRCGGGPYASYVVDCKGSSVHPLWYGNDPGDRIFGFDSEEDLRSWWGEPYQYKQAVERDLVICLYEGEDVERGERQCVFTPVSLIHQYPFENWFNGYFDAFDS